MKPGISLYYDENEIRNFGKLNDLNINLSAAGTRS